MHYDFKRLSPRDFEELIRDLLQADWSITLETFTSGADDGIDLRHGQGQTMTVVQCKHYATAGFGKLLSHLRRVELRKVDKLRPARYVLACSVSLTPGRKARIVELLAPFVQRSVEVLGCDDLNNLLVRHRPVELKHFKLWLASTAILQRVLHNSEHTSTDFAIRRIHARLRMFVQNACYTRATRLLRELNVAIIAGAPGVGKTTLAELLVYAHISEGYEPVIVRTNVEEGCRMWRPESKQIFYFDDFLGQSFLGEQRDFLSRNYDVALLDFIELIRTSKHSRLVMTTRTHILRRALQQSGRFGHSSIRDLGCVLEVEDYTIEQRARMLYNHVYFGDLPRAYWAAFVDSDFLMEVLEHEHFNPRVIEWISSYRKAQRVSPRRYQRHVLATLASPREVWLHSFEREIGAGSRSMVLALVTLGGEAPLETLLATSNVLHGHRRAKYGFPAEANEMGSALQELEGAFVCVEDSLVGQLARRLPALKRASSRIRDEVVKFTNPSVAEFARGVLCQSDDHATDVLETLKDFEQLQVVWSCMQNSDSHPGFLRKHQKLLEHSFLRLVVEPLEEQQCGADGWRSRLSVLAGLCTDGGLRGLAGYAPKIIGRLFDECGCMHCLTFAFDAANSLGECGRSLREQLSVQIFQELALLEDAGWAGFFHVDEACSRHWTCHERRKLSVAFDRYVCERLEADVARMDVDKANEFLRRVHNDSILPKGKKACARFDELTQCLDDSFRIAGVVSSADGEVVKFEDEEPAVPHEVGGEKVVDLLEALVERLKLPGDRNVEQQDEGEDQAAHVLRLFRSLAGGAVTMQRRGRRRGVGERSPR